jgi:asparaginyl-tRNA synthetase
LKDLFSFALDQLRDELLVFERWTSPGLLLQLEETAQKEFEILTYTEAIEILKRSGEGFQYPVEWGLNLQSEHERYLAEVHVRGPLVVIDYPKEIKPFYMKQNPDGRTVRAMDVLLPRWGEIIGGSQREDDLDTLVHRMRELGMDLDNYWWYLDLRRFGSAPHSGFGLGFERMLLYITGLKNIRDVIPFPRSPNNLVV